MSSSSSNNAALLVGRILLAIIFVLSGFGKLSNPAGTMGYMESAGLPGLLVWPTIALEFIGGLALVAGFQTRLVSLALAAFTLVAALIFHRNLADQMQMINFMKNLAISGGFLALYVAGPGLWSLDARRGAVPALSRV
jgi:putative oxidoreductase